MSSGRPCHPALLLDHLIRIFTLRNKMANPGAIFIIVLLCIFSDFCVVHGQTAGGYCTNATTGGSAGGAPCIFPFVYKNTTYDDCTTADNRGIAWCYTEVQPGNRWGNCILCASSSPSPTTTPTAAAISSSTVASSTAAPSCPVFTRDGNAGGKACVFPFTYRGASFSSCTKISSDFLWCATTATYDVDQEWGNCIIYTNKSSAPCVFPFTVVVGSNKTTYNTCTSDYTPAGVQICGIQSPVIIGGPQMGFCQPEGYCPSVFPPTATTTATTTPTTTTVSSGGNVSPNSSPVQCSVPTVGGNSSPGATCKFPFVYRGVTFNNCTNEGWNQPWCATTNNYPVDNKFGNCVIRHLSGAQCKFPFMYKGTEYYHCTGTDQSALWCATTYSFTGFSSAAWGYCDIRYEPKCGVPNTVAPGPACAANYETVKNALSLGGRRKTAYNMLDQCRDGCTADSACAAFDFDFGYNECYFHGPTYNSTLRTTGVTNVNQYRKEPCVRSTTVASSGGPGCVDSFTRMQNTLSLKGTEVTSVSALDACRTACLSDQTCVAFDFDNNFSQCFKHKDGYLLFVQLNKAGVDQYRRTVCQSASTTPSGCLPTYQKYESMKSFGGEEERGVVDVDGCKSACTAAPKCAAFDFDNTNLACFIHDTGYLNDLDSAATGVDQYRKDDSDCDAASDCSDTFQIYRNTLTRGGTPMSLITTSDACMAECLKIRDCAGFDFDLTASKCYYHKAGFDKNALTQADGVRDVHQYRRNACDYQDGSTTKNPQSTPAQSTTARPDSASTCVYEKIESTQSFGGNLVEGVSSVSLCKSACARRKPACPAFDFDKSSSKCYYHLDNYMLTVTYGVKNIDQYRLVECDCQNSYEVKRNFFAYGGIAQAGVTTVANCQLQCNKDVTCLGFDFNRENKGCFLHSVQTIDLQSTSNADTDQYKKVPCNESCITTYDMFLNTLSTGGTANSGSSTVTRVSCERACTADSSCKAFDFDTRRNKCYLHSEGFMDSIQTQENGVKDVNQYRKKPCDENSKKTGRGDMTTTPKTSLTTSPPTTSPTTKLSTTSTTWAPSTVLSTASTTPCKPGYSETLAAKAEGGTLQSNARTLSSCQDACSRSTSCAGLDFYVSTQCYLHTSSSIRTLRYDVRGVTHYRKLVCRIQPYVDAASGCTFKLISGQMSFFGVEKPQVTTVDSCKSVCLQDETCKAFDFNTVSNGCFLHYGQYESFTRYNHYINQYVKDCP